MTASLRFGEAWLHRVLGVLLIGFAVMGCSRLETEYGRPIPEDMTWLEEGQSDLHTVVHTLGPPTKIGALPDGAAFLYEHLRTRELQIGISLAHKWLSYFKLVGASADLDHTSLLLVFDEDGRLRSTGRGERTVGLGGGSGIQVIYSVVSLVDTSDYGNFAPQNRWGRGLLEPLPMTLNAAQDMDTGQAGLEQTGTPSGAGQHTLHYGEPRH